MLLFLSGSRYVGNVTVLSSATVGAVQNFWLAFDMLDSLWCIFPSAYQPNRLRESFFQTCVYY